MWPVFWEVKFRQLHVKRCDNLKAFVLRLEWGNYQAHPLLTKGYSKT